MVKTLLALFGILLIIAAISLTVNVRNGQKSAVLLDDEKHGYGMIGDDVPPFCSWEVREPERVMAENKSQAIVNDTNNTFDRDCESMLSLRAPGFDSSPSKEEQKIALPKGAKGSLSWILAPRRVGTYEIAVSDILNTKIFGVTVTNTFGLSATQAQVASFAGGIFGPMLTVPWWWDKWRGRKKREGQKEKEESPMNEEEKERVG